MAFNRGLKSTTKGERTAAQCHLH